MRPTRVKTPSDQAGARVQSPNGVHDGWNRKNRHRRSWYEQTSTKQREKPKRSRTMFTKFIKGTINTVRTHGERTIANRETSHSLITPNFGTNTEPGKPYTTGKRHACSMQCIIAHKVMAPNLTQLRNPTYSRIENSGGVQKGEMPSKRRRRVQETRCMPPLVPNLLMRKAASTTHSKWI